jgi:hypothetical protein
VTLQEPVAESLRFFFDCRSQARLAGTEAAVSAAALGQPAPNGVGVPSGVAGTLGHETRQIN